MALLQVLLWVSSGSSVAHTSCSYAQAMSAVLGERSKSCLVQQCNPLFLRSESGRSYPQVFPWYYTSVDTLNALFEPLSDPSAKRYIWKHNQPWNTCRKAQNAVSVVVTGVCDSIFSLHAHSVPGGSSPLTESSNVHGRDVAGSTGSQQCALAHELALH